MADSDFIHLSTLNYQKYAVNTTSPVSIGSGLSVDTTFSHGLGYIPAVRVWIELPGGEIYPISNVQFSSTSFITGNWYATTSDLVVSVLNGSGSTANVTLYVRIYYDE